MHCFRGTVFPRFYVLEVLCSRRPRVPECIGFGVRCSRGSMFPRFYVPGDLEFPSALFSGYGVPEVLCSRRSRFPECIGFGVRCSRGSLFPESYSFRVHCFQGPMFLMCSGVCVFCGCPMFPRSCVSKGLCLYGPMCCRGPVIARSYVGDIGPWKYSTLTT